MSAKHKIKALLKKIINIFAPEYECISCGREIIEGTSFMLCENCKNSIEWLNGTVCKKCGDKILKGNEICDFCKEKEFAFNSNLSYCYYCDASASIIKGLKYSSRKYYAKYIAQIMALANNAFKDVDIITFVPITDKRRRGRGYNQSEEIANNLAKLVNIKAINLLVKTFDKKNQAKLSQDQRMKNLIGSFELAENATELIKDKNILIVDDVFTTGATLNECAKVIRNAKPNKITTITFAKTKFEGQMF